MEVFMMQNNQKQIMNLSSAFNKQGLNYDGYPAKNQPAKPIKIQDLRLD